MQEFFFFPDRQKMKRSLIVLNKVQKTIAPLRPLFIGAVWYWQVTTYYFKVPFYVCFPAVKNTDTATQLLLPAKHYGF